MTTSTGTGSCRYVPVCVHLRMGVRACLGPCPCPCRYVPVCVHLRMGVRVWAHRRCRVRVCMHAGMSKQAHLNTFATRIKVVQPFKMFAPSFPHYLCLHRSYLQLPAGCGDIHAAQTWAEAWAVLMTPPSPVPAEPAGPAQAG